MLEQIPVAVFTGQEMIGSGKIVEIMTSQKKSVTNSMCAKPARLNMLSKLTTD